jgi:hypothetical protein
MKPQMFTCCQCYAVKSSDKFCVKKSFTLVFTTSEKVFKSETKCQNCVEGCDEKVDVDVDEKADVDVDEKVDVDVDVDEKVDVDVDLNLNFNFDFEKIIAEYSNSSDSSNVNFNYTVEDNKNDD